MALVAAQQRRGRGAGGAARVYASSEQHHSPQHRAAAPHHHDHHETHAATRLQARHRGNSARSLGIDPLRGEDRKFDEVEEIDAGPDAGERAVAQLTESQRAALRASFDEMDKDGSGLIDTAELRQALEKLGRAVTAREAKKVMSRADRDGSGKVDFDEFIRVVGPAIVKSSRSSEGAGGAGDGGGAGDDGGGGGANPLTLNSMEQQLDLVKDVDKVRAILNRHKYVIDPNSKYMGYWDPITMVALMFVAIVTPAEIAFTLNDDVDMLSPLFFINRAFDVIFLKDMVMQFFVAYPEPALGNRLIKDLRQIRRNYARSWFPIDLLSSVPFDLVGVALESMSGGDSASSLRAVRLVRLLRLVKMLRVLRGSRILQRWECEIAIPYSQIAIAKSGILLIFVSHWMACIWGLTASVQEGSATEEGGRYTWLDAAVSSKIGWNGNLASGYDDWSASFNGTEAEWERFAFMRDVKGVSEHYSVIDRYFLSLYFAVYTLTSIGYGDVSAQNLGEYIVATFLMASSSIIWAFTIGNFCSIVSTMDTHGVEFRRRMDELNFMLDDLGVDRMTRRRCRMYFYRSGRIQRVHNYHDLENMLSVVLRRELKSEGYLRLLHRQVWYLARVSDDCLQEITTQLQPMLYAPHEHFDKPSTMYICLRGIAAHRGRPMRKDAVWGKEFVLLDDEGALPEPTFACALTYVEVLVLQRYQLEQILGEFPEDAAAIYTARVFYRLKHCMMRYVHAVKRERAKEDVPNRRQKRQNSSFEYLGAKVDHRHASSRDLAIDTSADPRRTPPKPTSTDLRPADFSGSKASAGQLGERIDELQRTMDQRFSSLERMMQTILAAHEGGGGTGGTGGVPSLSHAG